MSSEVFLVATPQPAFDLIVFDWDGTLMDSTAAITTSIQSACRDLGLPMPSRERASHVIGLGLRDALAHVAPDIQPEQIDALADRYRHHYQERQNQLVLFDGIRELLVELKERGYRLAVATGKTRVGLNRALAATGLQPMFDSTRCADESFSKPHPAMLIELMEELMVEPSRTLMIGDTTHDLLMADSARAHGLGVGYGAHPQAELDAAPSRGVVLSVPALRDWLLSHA